MTDNEFNKIKERVQDARDTIADFGRVPQHITDREALIAEVKRLRVIEARMEELKKLGTDTFKEIERRKKPNA